MYGKKGTFEFPKRLPKAWIRHLEQECRVGSRFKGVSVVGRDERGTIVHLDGDAYKILHNGKNSDVFGNPLIGSKEFDPIFGNDTVGTSAEGIGLNMMYGSIFTSPSDVGTAQSLTFLSYGAVGTFPVKGVLVLNSTKEIVAVGEPVSVPVTKDWYTSSFATPPSLSPNTEYILMMIPYRDVYFYYTEIGPYGWKDATNSYASPTDPTDGSASNRKYCIYCTYTPPPKPKGTITVHAKLAGII